MAELRSIPYKNSNLFWCFITVTAELHHFAKLYSYLFAIRSVMHAITLIWSRHCTPFPHCDSWVAVKPRNMPRIRTLSTMISRSSCLLHFLQHGTARHRRCQSHLARHRLWPPHWPGRALLRRHPDRRQGAKCLSPGRLGQVGDVHGCQSYGVTASAVFSSWMWINETAFSAVNCSDRKGWDVGMTYTRIRIRID